MFLLNKGAIVKQPDWTKSFSTQANSRGKPGLKGLKIPSGIGGVKCMPRNLTFTEKHALQKTLARYVLGGEGGSTGTKNLIASVYSPSNRLRCKITVAFEPDNQSSSDPAFGATAPTWTIRAMHRNPETGRETPLQIAYPTSGSQSLPDAYEFDSAVELLRVTATVSDTSFASSYVPNTQRCNVVIVAQWEPNVEMSNTERDALYALCSITYGNPTLITNNAV